MATLKLPRVVRRTHCAHCTYPALYGLVVTHEALALIFHRPLRRLTIQATGRSKLTATCINTLTDETRNAKCK